MSCSVIRSACRRDGLSDTRTLGDAGGEAWRRPHPGAAGRCDAGKRRYRYAAPAQALARCRSRRSLRTPGQGCDPRAGSCLAAAPCSVRRAVRPLGLLAHSLGVRRPDPARAEPRGGGDGADNVRGAEGDGKPGLYRATPACRQPAKDSYFSHSQRACAQKQTGPAGGGGEPHRRARRADARRRRDAAYAARSARKPRTGRSADRCESAPGCDAPPGGSEGNGGG